MAKRPDLVAICRKRSQGPQQFEEWKCQECNTAFMRIVRLWGRRRTYCDKCSTPLASYHRARKVKKSDSMTSMIRAQEEIPQIIEAMVDNPGISLRELSAHLNIPSVRIQHYMNNNIALWELRKHASRKISEMLPKAIQAIDEIVQDKDHKQRLQAATEILKSERIFGSERIDVNVSVEKKTIEELRQIIQEAAKIPEPTVIETELISDTSNP